MQGPHQSDPEKFTRINLFSVCAICSAVLMSVCHGEATRKALNKEIIKIFMGRYLFKIRQLSVYNFIMTGKVNKKLEAVEWQQVKIFRITSIDVFS